MVGKNLIKLGDTKGKLVMFTAGLSDIGRPAYAYVLLYSGKYKSFLDAVENGNFDVSDYGQILGSGEGFEPSETIQQEMEEKYDVRYELDDELRAKLKKLS